MIAPQVSKQGGIIGKVNLPILAIMINLPKLIIKVGFIISTKNLKKV